MKESHISASWIHSVIELSIGLPPTSWRRDFSRSSTTPLHIVQNKRRAGQFNMLYNNTHKGRLTRGTTITWLAVSKFTEKKQISQISAAVMEPRTQASGPRPRPRTSKLSSGILEDEDLSSRTPTLDI